VVREQRKLAAILAADVVGYSRQMGRDEAETLARLRTNRSEHLDPVLAKYGGCLVKLTGDGALVEFPDDPSDGLHFYVCLSHQTLPTLHRTSPF
jgi:class 3 adenylate cyclase